MLQLIFIIKIILFSIWLIIIRGTMPRYRVDQLLLHTWKDWIFIWLSFFLYLLTYIIYFII